MNSRADRSSARGVVALRHRPLGAESAGVEEETGGESAADDGDQHGDDDNADAGKYEGQRIELHVPTIFACRRGAQVGPKVTSL
jgi:hypothetical protein